jgi:hypothetical protein
VRVSASKQRCGDDAAEAGGSSFPTAIRDHQSLCAILPNLKKTGSSAGNLGLANENASWFRYALFNNLRTHLIVLRRGNQPISRALEQTFAAHQLAVIQTIRGEVEKGVFTFTGLGIGVGWTLCCVSNWDLGGY